MNPTAKAVGLSMGGSPPPDHRPRSREEITSFILEHPVFQRFMQLQSLDAHAYCTHLEKNPWLAFGEQLLMAGDIVNVEGSSGLEPSLRIELAETVIHAQTYFWQSKPLFTASEMPVPRHTFSARSLAFPSMYWSFPGNLECVGSGIFAAGYLLMPDGDDLIIWFNARNVTTGSFVLSTQIIKSGIFPDAFMESEDDLRSARGLCQLLAFLNSPYIEKNDSQPDRSTRRWIAHNRKYADSVFGVKVVTLRSPAVVKEELEGNREVTRAWLHRWWVRGHIRAQWYPGRKDHQLLWIAPHLKGPDGKPVLVKTYSVAR